MPSVIKRNLSVIAPVFNESAGVHEFISRMSEVFAHLGESGWSTKLILVEDGSKDDTWDKLIKTEYSITVKIIRFSRNFGHQTAVWAGIENSEPLDYVVVMDSDLQDPPEELSRIVSEFENFKDCVLMKRISRRDGYIKKMTASFYYSIMAKLSSSDHAINVGDFYGLSPRAKLALLSNKERIKYIRGLVSQLGFKNSTLEYHREGRFAGKTNYTITKMFTLALAGVTGFSITPLIMTVYLAAIGAFMSLALIFYVLWLKFFSSTQLQPGWAFLSIGSLLTSTFALTSLSAISLYVARIVQEVKLRPLYYIDEIVEIDNKKK